MLIYIASVCKCGQRSLGNSSPWLRKAFLSYLVVLALLVAVLIAVDVVVVGAGAMSLTC